MEYSHVARCAAFTLWWLTIAGCATTRQPEILTSPCEEQQHEIIRLQQLLTDKEQQISSLIAHHKNKELEISNLKAHQQNQVKELKETSNQIARAEVKLRRFATEADVASRLAEVEVAMDALESSLNTEHEMPLQVLAQRLLDKASISFKRGKYSAAADHAAQAEQLIDMLMDHNAIAELRVSPETLFKVAIPLKIKADSQLRKKPHSNAVILDELQKATRITARSYQEQWLQVQTEDGSTGWIFVDSVEPR